LVTNREVLMASIHFSLAEWEKQIAHP
jgi:hypothetical protein